MGSTPLSAWKPTEEDVAFVRSVVERWLRPFPAVRDDLVQETLIVAVQARGARFEPRQLLYGVARNLVKNWLRENVPGAELALEEMGEAQEPVVPGPEDAFRAAERHQAIEECLLEVPARYRDFVVRFDLEKEPMKSIAAEHGICANTGYNRLRLGREALAAALDRYCARRRIRKDDLLLPMLVSGCPESGNFGAKNPGTDYARTSPWQLPVKSIWPWVAVAAGAAAVAVVVWVITKRPLVDAAVAREAARLPEVLVMVASLGGGPTPIVVTSAAPAPESTSASVAPTVATYSAPATRPKSASTARRTDVEDRSSEVVSARRIRQLLKSGQTRAAAIEAAAFREKSPRTTLVLPVEPAAPR